MSQNLESVERLPPLRGIHHLKIPVADLPSALAFYEKAFGARRLADLDHVRPDGSTYAYILDVPHLSFVVELRLDPIQAVRSKGFDAVTFAVDDHAAVQRWAEHFQTVGVEHSPVLTALLSWIVVAEDPDGNRFRLYALAGHDGALRADHDERWI
jgi:catechol 2,3-dioxygenase-like lactoylglutathione lyase family enzyme